MENLTLSDILENKPPGKYNNVQHVITTGYQGTFDDKGYPALQKPPLQLYCDKCGGTRLFEYNAFPFMYEDVEIEGGNDTTYNYVYIEYLCQNCKETIKSYFLLIDSFEENEKSANIIKVGEYPFYCAIIPPKLITLLQDDKELFIKGVNAESHNLGIAAFTYYRRVVENQKNQLIDKLIKILSLQKTNNEAIETIVAAKKEKSFTKAIEKFKDFIPIQLFIENNNPFTLLHDYLSIGVHRLSDQECLEYAKSIRLVLTEFINRMANILKNDRDLKESVKKLARIKQKNE